MNKYITHDIIKITGNNYDNENEKKFMDLLKSTVNKYETDGYLVEVNFSTTKREFTTYYTVLLFIKKHISK